MTSLVTLISALLIIAGKFFVKIFITVFGWAMVIFFGRIPEEKSRMFSLLAVLSLIWVMLIIGLTYPALVKPFYDYIPYHDLKRLVYIILETIGVIVIPVAVGELAAFIQGNEKGKWKNYVAAVFVGYLYSFLMGIAMILMLLFAPIITAKRYLKREKAVHMPVVIPEGNTKEIIEKMEASLQREGHRTTRRRTPVIYRLPVLFVRKIMKRLLAVEGRQNEMLQGKEFRIFINPTDIMIEGDKTVIEYVRIEITKELLYNDAFLTYSDTAQKMETQALSIYRKTKTGEMAIPEGLAEIRKLKNQAKYQANDYEEWEMISLQLLTFENSMQKAFE